MKRTTILYLIIGIIGISLLFLGTYFFIFHSGLSQTHSDWGDFGSYFAGTIGVCLSFLGVYLLYLTLKEERKTRIEEMYQQYVSNYYSLLNLIKENWLHKEEATYNNGREIFGNSVRVINIDKLEDEILFTKNSDEWKNKFLFDINEIRKETNNENESFKRGFLYIYDVHINVFLHYCNSLIVFIERIFKNKDINNEEKEDYTNRLLTTLSLFELIFFSYFIVYIYKGEYQNEIRRKILTYIPKAESESFKYLQKTHISQVKSIVEILKGSFK